MYPQLFNQAARFAPVLSRILQRGGSFATPFWKTNQIGVPDVNAQPYSGPQVPISGPQTPTPPISGPQTPTPSQPSVPALGGLGLFPEAHAQPSNWLADAQRMPVAPTPTAAPLVSTPTQSASVPMPQARPAGAAAAPDPMSFFQRNTAMMRDPGTGEFIDPTAARQAQVSGPDLINKMMTYLHNKA